MERYAPTMKDLAPRDMVARYMSIEVREGRGAGPNKDYVLLDLTHLEPAHIDAKLPDITEFARTYLGVEPYTEPVPVYPTAHYAMGGVPTNIERRGAARQRPRRARPLRRRRGGLRLGARRQPAGHQLAAGHQRLRPPRRASPPPSTPPSADLVELPAEPESRVVAMVSSADELDRHRAGRQPAHRAAGDDGPQRPGVPHRGHPQAGQGRRRRAARSATRTSPSATRASATTSTCSRPSSWASCSTWPRCWSTARWPATSRAAVTPARTTRTATTSTSCATRWPTAKPNGDDPAGLQARRRHPLPADGAQVLMSCHPERNGADGRAPTRGHAHDLRSRSAASTPRSTSSRTGRRSRSRRYRPTACSTCCTRSSGTPTDR